MTLGYPCCGTLTEHHADTCPEFGKIFQFEVGQSVRKYGGDYAFSGKVVSAFRKLDGRIRYVVEDDRGILHFFNTKNLRAD